MQHIENPLLLLIESSGSLCSVALAKGEEVLALKEERGKGIHTRLITVFIEEVLFQAGFDVKAVRAVVLSGGPGSYTGLRVGASAAKGICYALDIPLIAVSTTRALAMASRRPDDAPDTLYVPMIDAGRMEVYTAVYDMAGKELSALRSLVLEKEVFSDYASRPLVFSGSGMEKARPLLKRDQIAFRQISLSAVNLLSPALQAFAERQFEELIRYEPLYLKAPHITRSKKKSC